MAAAKPEILIFQLVYQIATKFKMQINTMFSWSGILRAIIRAMSDTSGSRKFKMAATQTGNTYNSAMLIFLLSLESDIARSIAIKMPDHENMRFAFLISLLSGIQAEL